MKLDGAILDQFIEEELQLMLEAEDGWFKQLFSMPRAEKWIADRWPSDWKGGKVTHGGSESTAYADPAEGGGKIKAPKRAGGPIAQDPTATAERAKARAERLAKYGTGQTGTKTRARAGEPETAATAEQGRKWTHTDIDPRVAGGDVAAAAQSSAEESAEVAAERYLARLGKTSELPSTVGVGADIGQVASKVAQKDLPGAGYEAAGAIGAGALASQCAALGPGSVPCAAIVAAGGDVAARKAADVGGRGLAYSALPAALSGEEIETLGAEQHKVVKGKELAAERALADRGKQRYKDYLLSATNADSVDEIPDSIVMKLANRWASSGRLRHNYLTPTARRGQSGRGPRPQYAKGQILNRALDPMAGYGLEGGPARDPRTGAVIGSSARGPWTAGQQRAAWERSAKAMPIPQGMRRRARFAEDPDIAALKQQNIQRNYARMEKWRETGDPKHLPPYMRRKDLGSPANPAGGIRQESTRKNGNMLTENQINRFQKLADCKSPQKRLIIEAMDPVSLIAATLTALFFAELRGRMIDEPRRRGVYGRAQQKDKPPFTSQPVTYMLQFVWKKLKAAAESRAQKGDSSLESILDTLEKSGEGIQLSPEQISMIQERFADDEELARLLAQLGDAPEEAYGEILSQVEQHIRSKLGI